MCFYQAIEDDQPTEEVATDYLELDSSRKLDLINLDVNIEKSVRLFRDPSSKSMRPKIMTLKLNIFDEDKENLGDLFETQELNLSQYFKSHKISKD